MPKIIFCMEYIYLFYIIVLIILAVSDLIVGVSNDAVNFLVGAIGSKAAPYWIIMIVASLGVAVGATFSNGMMEVARKGIFHPEMFFFNEIMIIFLAVMITDVLMLDVFNTLGLPTSTTVSLVFELLGAAIAMSLIKLSMENNAQHTIADYINHSKALEIIRGIFASIVIAFTVGLVAQFFARLIFSFNYARTYKQFGALWGGLSITAITYFMLVKGIEGSTFAEHKLGSGVTIADWVQTHTLPLLAVSFGGWTLIMEFCRRVFNMNIFKGVVLVGTFALAMAFAGNDLVNFIGVPLAGLQSFHIFQASGIAHDQLTMEALTGAVKTPPMYLIIAGLIMVITLWFSKKARSVTATSVNLSRQEEGTERFSSNMLSRFIVRSTVKVSQAIETSLPSGLKSRMSRRFEPLVQQPEGGADAPAFDLVRGSVNLLISSSLIAVGTSLKLPLSTTYVTFLVAMGSSLADGAWGRESAVYRVSGVISVILGWFVTAVVAFTVAFLVANVIYIGGSVATACILGLGIIIIIRSRIIHRRKEEVKETQKTIGVVETSGNIAQVATENVLYVVDSVNKIFKKLVEAIETEDDRKLRACKKEADELNKYTEKQKAFLPLLISKLRETNIDTAHLYVQEIDYLREFSNSFYHVIIPVFEHFNNSHRNMLPEQIVELKSLVSDLSELLETFTMTESSAIVEVASAINKQQDMLTFLTVLYKKQIKRIRSDKKVGMKNALLYLTLLAEMKNLLLFCGHLVKSHRDMLVGSRN